ncbi:sensor domain-containing diguanylate cyclase [Ectothiorhodospira mobilis]|uniref:sensor domain-containing diguanylate cyclase n=1 Tax=Ectothiorhodospira mobilis TaxID=195064 RepID=UPI001EE83509|nr:diguanylate cyclase [Ectothiorhodospira mobilis]MCG5535178.1 diguanylate cyclase [Ectothiorhodospira mobilis]
MPLKPFRPSIALVYLVLGGSFALLSLTFYVAGFQPLAERLREAHGQIIDHTLDSTRWVVQGALDRHIALARQTASRSAIRQQQVRYLAGEMDLADLRAFATPKLRDALKANDELLGIRRLAPDGTPLLQVGWSPPPLPEASRCTLPETGDQEGGVRIHGPFPLKGRQVLVYCSPLHGPGGERIGMDQLLMDAAPVQNILQTPHGEDLDTVTLGVVAADGRLLFWPRGAIYQDARQRLKAHLAGNPIGDGVHIHYRPLASVDWRIYGVVHTRAFFAETNRQLWRLLGLLAMLAALIFVAKILALRPIIRALTQVHHLTEQAHRDGMTGLFNHAHMQQLIDREIERSQRYKTPFSILMMDIDHFKEINDTHGHPVGDAFLRHIARILKDWARTSDLAARYGGEEFMVILPETDPHGALSMAERLREEIARQPLEHRGQKLQISVSIGVVSCAGKAVGSSRTQLVRAVDDALYTSKRGGRDRVTQTVIDTAIPAGA